MLPFCYIGYREEKTIKKVPLIFFMSKKSINHTKIKTKLLSLLHMPLIKIFESLGSMLYVVHMKEILRMENRYYGQENIHQEHYHLHFVLKDKKD